MSAIKIEKGVPVTGNSTTYPFDEMEIGDSFLVSPCDTKGRMKVYASSRYFLSKIKTPKFKFKSRVDADGYRFWKVKI